MAKQQQQQRRPAQTPAPRTQGPAPKRPAPPPAPARRAEKRERFVSASDRAFIYTRENFILMGIGLGLVLLGLALMGGGAMPDPKVWEPERIYSFRRITLAPLMMVAGFVVVGYAIFKKPNRSESLEVPPADNLPEA